MLIRLTRFESNWSKVRRVGKSERHHQGRVAWVGMRKVVERELAEGWSARAIYDRHAAKFANRLSYAQFVRYVRPLRVHKPLPSEVPKVRTTETPSPSAPEPAEDDDPPPPVFRPGKLR